MSVLGVAGGRRRTAGGLTVPDPTSDQARSVVRVLQPRKPAREPVWVTGQAAFVNDFVDDVQARAPLAAGVVVLATFVLLFLLTGSRARAAQGARARTSLSLGATFGVLVWVFQDGPPRAVLLGFDADRRRRDARSR